jgi:hypothetical protein
MTSHRNRFVVRLLVSAFIFSAPVRSVCGEDQEQRNKDAVLKYLRPALKEMGGSARLYLFTPCAGGQRPLRFPRIIVQPPSKGAKGLEAIRQIFQNDKRVAVNQGQNGMIRISVGRTPTEVFRTRIRSLRLKPDNQYTGLMAMSAILSASEVEATMRKLRLEHPVVVVSIHILEPMEGLPHLPPVIRNLTLDEALDLLATTFGGLVISEQCVSSDGTGYFDADIESVLDYTELQRRDRRRTHP